MPCIRPPIVLIERAADEITKKIFKRRRASVFTTDELVDKLRKLIADVKASERALLEAERAEKRMSNV